MIGETISHYRIVEKLGGGGMGVVYKALDLRLDRYVALKFLPPELTRDDEANKRFMHEARAASALDHPHICTIYEIDEPPGGQVFLAMAYYDGETLKKRIARGPLAVEEVAEIAIQIAQGLARAHDSGIIHRDIKPANLMITADGVVKILDFGLAKLTGQSDLTRTGVTVGTVAYMSPEQIRGTQVDQRTDVWALGVVLYEMLEGQQPFPGGGNVATLNAILNDMPRPITGRRERMPAELQRIVLRALDKNVAQRYSSVAELLKDLTAYNAARAQSAGSIDLHAALQFLRTPRIIVPAGVLLLVGAVLAGVAVRRSSRVTWAREGAIPEITRHIAADNYIAAFAVAEEAERYTPNDPVLAELWPQISASGSIVTEPAAADVYMQEYGATNDEWTYLGRSPITDRRLPRGVFTFKVEKDGFETQTLAAKNPGSLLRNQTVFNTTPVTVSLPATGTAPEMVPVPGGTAPVSLTGFNLLEPITLEPFLIDRHEVTNAAFKQFLDGGGYDKEEHWQGSSFSRDGRQLAREEAVDQFRDSTGRPGPAAWELGDYPSGQADYPVAGLSWYEAAAYCQSKGKTLPTIFHWARAALSPLEVGSALAPAIVPLSNFGRGGPARVETFRGLGPYGTYDMAGNVREWTWNESADGRRWILGGAWSDPDYLFTVGNDMAPFDRSETNGFRCAQYGKGAVVPPQLLARTALFARDYRTAKAVSDEVFQVFKSQFGLVKAPLNDRLESTDTARDWIREKISLDAGYDGERLAAYLFLPRNVEPPYQLAVVFPPLGGSFFSRSSSANLRPGGFEYVVRSGRALVRPIYKGSYERWDSFLSLTGDEYLRTFRARMFDWRQDLGRVLDVLGKRRDIAIDQVAYLGDSFGASTPLPLLALEDRLKVAVLNAPGLTDIHVGLPPPEADSVNYVSHVTIPVLMIGGRQDYLFPLETSQMPLFNRLGTPAEHKRHIVFDGGHQQFPRSATIREVLAWLDRYLGPVRPALPTSGPTAK